MKSSELGKEVIKKELPLIPKSPGVYRMLNHKDDILYVGKAKNLKNRVSSYFNNKQSLNKKTKYLVQQIVRIEYTVVENETDALLLENNLIKKLQPRYNILLKDDKSYPWICIKNEPFSRIFPTRRITKDGSEYYGPYTNFKIVNTILEMIKELYPLRTCKYDLSHQNVNEGKYKVCLEYHLKNCNGAVRV